MILSSFYISLWLLPIKYCIFLFEHTTYSVVSEYLYTAIFWILLAKNMMARACHSATATPPSGQGIQRDSLALLKHTDLMFDLVELPRHPAVLLVHLNALPQRHTGRHRLRKRQREVPDIRWIRKNEKYRMIYKNHAHVRRKIPLILHLCPIYYSILIHHHVHVSYHLCSTWFFLLQLSENYKVNSYSSAAL